jgi:hypothetical protein
MSSAFAPVGHVTRRWIYRWVLPRSRHRWGRAPCLAPPKTVTLSKSIQPRDKAGRPIVPYPTSCLTRTSKPTSWKRPAGEMWFKRDAAAARAGHMNNAQWPGFSQDYSMSRCRFAAWIASQYLCTNTRITHAIQRSRAMFDSRSRPTTLVQPRFPYDFQSLRPTLFLALPI